MEFVLVQHDLKSSTPRALHLFGWMPLWFQSQAASVEGGPFPSVCSKEVHSLHSFPSSSAASMKAAMATMKHGHFDISSKSRVVFCVCAPQLWLQWTEPKYQRTKEKQNQTTQKKQQQNGKAKSLKSMNQESWSRSSHFLRWCELI